MEEGRFQMGIGSDGTDPDGPIGDVRLRPADRARVPWILFAAMLLLLAFTLTFTILNGTFETFVAIAVAMMLGYGTMGALVASRLPHNPLGWLMIAIGLGFVVAGLTAEYVTYAFVTNPGPLPFPKLATWLQSWVGIPTIAGVPLVLLLFPTGRVPSSRWRVLVPTIVGLTALLALFIILTPGPIQTDTPGLRIDNPTGVQALDPFIGALTAVVFFALLAATLAAAVALILRFRRSSGDERQQIRWLAYLVLAALMLLVAAVFSSGALNDILFYALFACVGIAFPVAIAVAILKYRLYDLDLVVRKAVLAFVLVAAITIVALVVAVAIPLAVFGIGGSSVSVVAVAAGVAIGFVLSSFRSRARGWADRVVFGRRATPYEVLSEFAERAGSAYSTDDVLPRLAQLLAAGTGATEACVWLHVAGEYRAAAAWPAGTGSSAPIRATGQDLPTFPRSTATFPVRHQGTLLGVLTLTMPASDPMSPAKERLIHDVAGQAGLVLRNVRLIEELRESRRRIVTAQDERARSLERNIHDGAQQHLVALSVKQRIAKSLIERDPEKARQLMAEIETDTTDALENLRDLARGIYPPVLADRGLPAALESQIRKTAITVHLQAGGLGRYAPEMEAAVYFCCLESLQNVAKYAEASNVTVQLSDAEGWLQFIATDDGVGFDLAETPPGSGLQGMSDRLEALGGGLEIRSRPGSGTILTGRIPTGPPTPGA